MFEFEVVEDDIVLVTIVFSPVDVTVEVKAGGRVKCEGPFCLAVLSGGNEK